MNCNKRKRETASLNAVLLLAVIEEVRVGHITNGFISLNDQMVAAFKHQWNRYVVGNENNRIPAETSQSYEADDDVYKILKLHA